MEKATDFRDLLTINPKKPSKLKNELNVWMKWDSNDADYIERTETMEPECLFGNKKLIYCLAYITANKCMDKELTWRNNDPLFGEYVTHNRVIEDLETILSENDFMVYSDWGSCHTCEGLEITYYDENGTPFEITFDDIHKEFEKMTHQEICDKINSIED